MLSSLGELLMSKCDRRIFSWSSVMRVLALFWLPQAWNSETSSLASTFHLSILAERFTCDWSWLEPACCCCCWSSDNDGAIDDVAGEIASDFELGRFGFEFAGPGDRRLPPCCAPPKINGGARFMKFNDIKWWNCMRFNISSVFIGKLPVWRFCKLWEICGNCDKNCCSINRCASMAGSNFCSVIFCCNISGLKSFIGSADWTFSALSTGLDCEKSRTSLSCSFSSDSSETFSPCTSSQCAFSMKTFPNACLHCRQKNFSSFLSSEFPFFFGVWGRSGVFPAAKFSKSPWPSLLMSLNCFTISNPKFSKSVLYIWLLASFGDKLPLLAGNCCWVSWLLVAVDDDDEPCWSCCCCMIRFALAWCPTLRMWMSSVEPCAYATLQISHLKRFFGLS